MELLQQVVANLEIDESKAEKGIGAILTALRMSSGKETFEHVKAAVPNAESMMGHALMSGARTAELAAPVGPAGLMAALAAAGVKKDDVPRLGRIVLEFLRPSVGSPVIDAFLEKAPGLKG
ncbi:MAG TPA: DUF2780 domain-containing protein [Gemmatimonadales bacterium]